MFSLPFFLSVHVLPNVIKLSKNVKFISFPQVRANNPSYCLFTPVPGMSRSSIPPGLQSDCPTTHLPCLSGAGMTSLEKDSFGNTGGVQDVQKWIAGPRPMGVPVLGGARWREHGAPGGGTQLLSLEHFPTHPRGDTCRLQSHILGLKHAQVDCPGSGPPGWPPRGFLRKAELEPRAS